MGDSTGAFMPARKNNRSETDEPWKNPGQSSQELFKKEPPRRELEEKDNETA
jgi:hypothetical protein